MTHNVVTAEPSSWEQAVDLRGLIRLLWSRRQWLFVPMLVLAAGAYVTAWILDPQYEVSTVLIPANTDKNAAALGSPLGQFGGLASLAGIGLSLDSSGSDEALAVLRSRQFNERFIQDHKLMAVLYPKRWDAVTDKCIVEESKCPTLPRALEKFDKIRGINSERQTGLVTLSIRWRDGEQAAFWANDLVVRLNQEMRSRVIAQADASLEYLQRELGVTSQIETRDAINRLVDGQVKQRMLASVSAEYSFRVVDPATAPDPRDPVWPKKWLFLLLGAVGGLLIGVGAILVSVEVTRPQRT